jgi:hypothetical protein
MPLVRRFIGILRQNARPYAALNLAYYGLVLAGMMAVSGHPAWSQALRNTVRSNFNQTLLQAYADGSVLLAIYLTFYNNFVLASLLAITLPSMLIPFWGLAVGVIRAVLWGLALSPADPAYGVKIIPHALTGLLEGQGYVLAMLAVYLLWRNCFWPRRAGAPSHLQGYRIGLEQTVILYAGVFVLLAVGAMYEAIAAIYLVRALQ